MRYVRNAVYAVVLLILFTFGFQNYDALTSEVDIRFSLLGLWNLGPGTYQIWQIFLGTAFIVFLSTVAFEVATVLSLRTDVWKRDRELRVLRAQLEESEAEIKRLKAQSGGGTLLPTSSYGEPPSPLQSTEVQDEEAEDLGAPDEERVD